MPRVLIVDDEPKICECLKAFLETRGFEVDVAYDGDEALQRMIHQVPDAILLDMHLPDISGIDVLKRAKDVCPEARILMVTADGEEETRMDAKSYGACGYITKPFDFSDLTWLPLLSDQTS